METTKFIWQNGALKLWEESTTHVLSHSLHYGGGVFEGIRCYETPKGTAIFRLKEHVDRLYYSAKTLEIEIPYSKEEFFNAVIETVKNNELSAGYIRPIVYLGYGKMGLNPVGAKVESVIACWPWGKYINHDHIKVVVSPYRRIHNETLKVDAKVSGHYVNSMMSILFLRKTDAQEALMLDCDGNVAEGPGENFFMVKDGILYTPSIGSILPGITRATIIEMANDLGIQVIEKQLTTEEVLDADGCFFTGTAAEVTPINQFEDKHFEYSEDSITLRLKNLYEETVTGKHNQYEKFLTYVQ